MSFCEKHPTWYPTLHCTQCVKELRVVLEQVKNEKECYRLQVEKDYNESDQHAIMRLYKELAAITKERDEYFRAWTDTTNNLVEMAKALELACERTETSVYTPEYFRQKAREI